MQGGCGESPRTAARASSALADLQEMVPPRLKRYLTRLLQALLDPTEVTTSVIVGTIESGECFARE